MLACCAVELDPQATPAGVPTTRRDPQLFHISRTALTIQTHTSRRVISAMRRYAPRRPTVPEESRT